MRTISVANAKGGVGKTTVSVNLAYELCHRKHKVVVVDLDSQCDLTKIFQPPDYKGPTIADALLKRCKFSETMVAVEENLFLVPGSREIAQINFKGSENALLRFSKVFEAKKVDFVVIDHPPSLHNVALAGFVASDHVLVVCQAEGFSISNLHQLMTDLNAIKKDFQPNLQILGKHERSPVCTMACACSDMTPYQTMTIHGVALDWKLHRKKRRRSAEHLTCTLKVLA